MRQAKCSLKQLLRPLDLLQTFYFLVASDSRPWHFTSCQAIFPPPDCYPSFCRFMSRNICQ